MQGLANCPICSVEMQKWDRYPNLVCAECAERASDESGRRLKFYNESLSGGFVACFSDNGDEWKGHTCYIDGVKCRADEHRFGGIAIEVAGK